jgi:alpha-tubulin suppressor-like RCC1 family protein
VGGLTFTSLAAGVNHACGLTPNGTAYCWGNNSGGQLGTGATSLAPNPSPLPVAGGLTFAQLAAGGAHTCGLTANGALYCWGFNLNGPLGDGTEADHPTPQPVANGLTFAGVTAGGGHTCAWTPAGAGYCWGLNIQGQVGDGTSTFSLVPVPVLVP